MGETGRSYLGPIDRRWAVYVLGLSLMNVWIALIIDALSTSKPFHEVLTDGSLIVFCLVNIWLTFAAFRQEVQRGGWDRSKHEKFWKYHDIYCGLAVFVTILAVVCYMVLLLRENVTETARIVISVLAVVIGAGYSRMLLDLTYQAGSTSAPQGSESP